MAAPPHPPRTAGRGGQGGLKEEYEKRRNAKQVNSAASGKLDAFYISLVYHAVIRA